MLYEKEVLMYLNIPSIPKKKWDGEKPFKYGCGVVETKTGDKAFVVIEFSQKENCSFIKKVFGDEPIKEIIEIYPVPDYMDMKNIEDWDLDEESKKAAKSLAEEAIESEIQEQEQEDEEQTNEWYFDEIHNIDEARAWVAAYKKRKKMRGKQIKDEDSLKNFLYVAYKNQKRGL